MTEPAGAPSEGGGVACCIIARGRIGHLRRVLDGLAVQTTPADRVIVCAMADPAVATAASSHPVVTTVTSVACGSDEALPLSGARNRAASLAREELLVFLDVDCIPDERLVEDYRRQARPGLLMGGVRYLPAGVPAAGRACTGAELRSAGRVHPARPPVDRARPTSDYELFWSLNFAVRRRTWSDLGGFDEGYVGYGAEDTDLAFSARQRGVPAWFVAGAEAFHQHHETSDPPYRHLGSIVANARRFHARWGVWPMEGWLHAFAAEGLVRWTDRELIVRE